MIWILAALLCGIDRPLLTPRPMAEVHWVERAGNPARQFIVFRNRSTALHVAKFQRDPEWLLSPLALEVDDGLIRETEHAIGRARVLYIPKGKP